MEGNQVEYKTGNFAFVSYLSQEVCYALQKAERKVYTDCQTAGKEMRDAMEVWVNGLFLRNGLPLDTFPSLDKKLKELQRLRLVPYIEKRRDYDSEGEGKKQADVYRLWRWFGNNCAHPEIKPHWPKITTSNALVVLKGVYAVLLEEYRKQEGNEAANLIFPFDPFCIPFEDNYVIRSGKPLDADVTKCLREFETCAFRRDSNRLDSYGIVRMYKKDNMDEKMLHLRDQDAFSEAELDAGIGFDGNVQVKTIAGMFDEPNTFNEYYAVLYRFSKMPHRLNDKMLQTLSIDVRQSLCRKLAQIMRSFHTLPAPIYHRNLSYDSVFLCDGIDGVPVPSIIKLDCAKIESAEFGTVLSSVKDMKERMQQQKIMKYTPPEVNMMLQRGGTQVLWDKADVYALGVLFGDILNGEIGMTIVRSAKLQLSGAKIELVQLIDKMCHPKAELRPSMETVFDALKEIE